MKALQGQGRPVEMLGALSCSLRVCLREAEVIVLPKANVELLHAAQRAVE